MHDLVLLLQTLIPWAVVTGIVVFFRHPLKSLLEALVNLVQRANNVKGKILGQEMEVTVDDLQRTAISAAEEVEEAQPATIVATGKAGAFGSATLTATGSLDVSGAVVQPSSHSDSKGNNQDPQAQPQANYQGEGTFRASDAPSFQLIRLYADIERELRRIAAASLEREQLPLFPDLPSPYLSRYPMSRILRSLERYGIIPPSLVSAIWFFRRVRGEVIHGGDVDPIDVQRAIDSGTIILATLETIRVPLERQSARDKEELAFDRKIDELEGKGR